MIEFCLLIKMFDRRNTKPVPNLNASASIILMTVDVVISGNNDDGNLRDVTPYHIVYISNDGMKEKREK